MSYQSVPSQCDELHVVTGIVVRDLSAPGVGPTRRTVIRRGASIRLKACTVCPVCPASPAQHQRSRRSGILFSEKLNLLVTPTGFS